MSLVIARTTSKGVRLISDTRVTPSLQGPGRHQTPHFLRGALKAIVLHPSLCIGFAGDPEVAQDAIRALGIGSDALPDVDAVELALAHISERDQVEFIVASLAKGASITRITANIRERNLASAWIGDKDAFEAYQRCRNAYLSLDIGNDDPDVREAALMVLAMMAVINDPAIASVGEQIVTVNPEVDGFRYGTMGLRAGGNPDQVIPSGVQTPIQFGSAAQGGFSYTLMTPKEAGIGAVGAYFPFGHVGVLYYPMRTSDPQKISAQDEKAFREAALRDHGVDLEVGVGVV